MLPVAYRRGGPLEGVEGYASASDADRLELAGLVELAADAAEAIGLPTIYLTSWLRSSGAHATGSALDFTGPTRQTTADMWVWLAQNRRSSFGEVILEPPRTGNTGHVHVTLPGVGGRGQVLYQDEAGRFLEVDPSWAPSFAGGAIPIQGLTVTVPSSSSSSWWWWAGAAAFFLLWKRATKRHN